MTTTDGWVEVLMEGHVRGWRSSLQVVDHLPLMFSGCQLKQFQAIPILHVIFNRMCINSITIELTVRVRLRRQTDVIHRMPWFTLSGRSLKNWNFFLYGANCDKNGSPIKPSYEKTVTSFPFRHNGPGFFLF